MILNFVSRKRERPLERSNLFSTDFKGIFNNFSDFIPSELDLQVRRRADAKPSAPLRRDTVLTLIAEHCEAQRSEQRHLLEILRNTPPLDAALIACSTSTTTGSRRRVRTSIGLPCLMFLSKHVLEQQVAEVAVECEESLHLTIG